MLRPFWNKALIYITSLILLIYKLYIAFHGYEIRHNVLYGVAIYLTMTILYVKSLSNFIRANNFYNVKSWLVNAKEFYFNNFWNIVAPCQVFLYTIMYIIVCLYS